MSAPGQSRRFDRLPDTSGPPLSTDIASPVRLVHLVFIFGPRRDPGQCPLYPRRTDLTERCPQVRKVPPGRDKTLAPSRTPAKSVD
jgi:hypothetical protein